MLPARVAIVLLTCLMGAACSTSGKPRAHVPLAPFPAVAVEILDGDTLVVRHARNQQLETVRLAGIDAPELYQPAGTQSYDALKGIVAGTPLNVSAIARDEDGRLVAYVCQTDEPFFTDWRSAPCGPQDSVNRNLVRQGMAWAGRVETGRPEFADAEELAQELRIGIWQDAAPVPPWQWRSLPYEKKVAILDAQNRLHGTPARSSGYWATSTPHLGRSTTSVNPTQPLRSGDGEGLTGEQTEDISWLFSVPQDLDKTPGPSDRSILDWVW